MVLGTVYTGFGFWNVYAWVMFFALGALIVLFLRSTGRGDYEKGAYQDEVFYGGNPVPQDGEDLAVPASSSYWGFTKALSRFYDVLVSIHTGILSDYMGILVVTVAVISILILL